MNCKLCMNHHGVNITTAFGLFCNLSTHLIELFDDIIINYIVSVYSIVCTTLSETLVLVAKKGFIKGHVKYVM